MCSKDFLYGLSLSILDIVYEIYRKSFIFTNGQITGKQPAFCKRISARDESERSDTRVGRFTLEEDFI
jgi:hypothetical protein